MVKKRGIKQKIILFIILLVFIRISYSYGGEICGRLADGGSISCSPSDPNLLQYGDYDNPAFPWDQIDQSQIPTDRISEIPTDKVQVNDVADKSKLTKEQLEYNNNINKVPDWKELNQDVVGDILSDKINKNVKVNDADSGQVGDNSFSIPSVNLLTVEDTGILNGKNVQYKDNKLTADSAELIKNKDSLISKVDKFSEDKISIAFDKAQKLISGCVNTNGLSKSELVVSKEEITISTGEFNFRDCDGNNIKFKGYGEDSKITINKVEPNKIEVVNGGTTIEHDEHNETISTETFLIAALNEFGYECIIYGPKSKYYPEYVELVKDFMLYMNDDYKLCLRKTKEQNFELKEGNYGIVDDPLKLLFS